MPLPPFALERFFARHEFEAPHLLCASDCESMTVDELLAMEPGAAAALGALRLGYTESAGGPTLRSAIAALYSTVRRDDVLVTAGAEEGIFTFMHAALSPGDHLVVHQPCYRSLVEVARSIGCEVSPWAAREDRGWELDPDECASLIRPSTRVIVMNVPHNPTGYLMAADAFQRTLAPCRGPRYPAVFRRSVPRPGRRPRRTVFPPRAMQAIPPSPSA